MPTGSPIPLSRAPESREIAELLASDRWITIWGPAGAGKSEIVHALAASALDQGFEAVIRCRVERLETREELWARVAESLGDVPPPIPGGSRPRQLGAALALRGRALLILDGFEGVAGVAGPDLESWMSLAPELVVVVSSRRRCGSPSERVYELMPLGGDRGVKLFGAHFGRSCDSEPPESAVVERLVESLDGVPRAIEVAASALGLLGSTDLRVAQLLHIETGAGPSLSRASELSWRFLTELQRRTLLQLSVFERDFTLPDAEAVVDIGAGSVLPHLFALREAALLRSTGDGHFSLLSTERAVAQERLARADEEVAVRARHAEHFLRGERAASAPVEERVAALRFALATRSPDWLPDVQRGLIGLERSLEHAGEAELLSELATATVAWAQELGARDPRTACVRRLNGVRHRHAGRLAEATHHFEAAMTMAAETEASHSAARTATELLATELAAGRIQESRRRFEQALEHAAKCSETTCASEAYRQFADAASLAGNLEEALELRARAWELARGDRQLAARAAASLAIESLSAGDIDAFERFAPESLRELRELGDTRGVGILLVNIAVAEAMRGRPEEAVQSFRDAARQLRAVGDIATEASAMLNLAWMQQERDPSVGLRDLEAGHDLARQSGVLWLELLASAGLALTYAAVGRLGQYEILREKAEGFLAQVDLPSVAHAARLRLLAAELAVAKHRSSRAARSADRRARAALKEDDDGGLLVRSARRALERTREWRPGSETSSTRAIARVLVAEGSEWFRPPGGDWVDLRKRKTLRNILDALVRSASKGVMGEDLIAIGWPGEKILPKAAQARVHVAISSLRKLGLPVLRSDAGAYMIDPAYAVVTGYQAEVRFERTTG